MQTGLFFGTFNPVHRGHEALVSSFLSSGRIDELWIILTPNPPHKDISTLASFHDRWNMLKLAFEERQYLKISDVERRISPPNFTVKTLTYLNTHYSDRQFYLCIGSDTLQTLSSWYEYDKISSQAALLVAERPEISPKIPPELETFSVHFCEHRKVDISSTAIRESLAAGVDPGTEQLHPEVLRYINEHQLYR